MPYLLVVILSAGIASFGATDVIYFESRGYSITFIAVMISAFNISVAIAELPFAIIFDRFSIKLSLNIGFIVRIIGFLLFAVNWGPSWLILAQILAGIGTAAASGTTTALVLNEVKDQTYKNMSTEKSRLTLLSSFGSLFGATLGVFVFHSFPAGIWYLATVFFLLAIAIVYKFKDKQAAAADVELKQLFIYWTGIFRYKITYLFIVLNASAIAPIFLWQLKFKNISSSFVIVGFYAITITSFFTAKLFPVLKLKLSSVKYVALLNVLTVILFALSQGAISMTLTFMVCILMHLLLSIQIEGLFHSCVDNRIRASAGSIISLFDSAVVSMAVPVIGYVADRFGLFSAISLSGLLYLIIALLSFSLAATTAQK